MPRLFDVLLGRSRSVPAHLDNLFGLTSAQITLQASESLVPTGEAGVCFKPVAGRSFADTAAEASQLLGLPDGTETRGRLRQEDDDYGFHWVVQSSTDFQQLVNEVHLVNSTLQDNGYGPQLLCSVFAFRPDSAGPQQGAPPLVYLVYLYKRGAFYPFVPLPGSTQKRDVETELRLQTVLADDVKIEPDKERWMPLWGLPVA